MVQITAWLLVTRVFFELRGRLAVERDLEPQSEFRSVSRGLDRSQSGIGFEQGKLVV